VTSHLVEWFSSVRRGVLIEFSDRNTQTQMNGYDSIYIAIGRVLAKMIIETNS